MDLPGWFSKNKQVATKKQQVKGVKLPTSRVSYPSIQGSFTATRAMVSFLTPKFQREYIPVIRKLVRVNSSVSRSVNILTELINSGIEIKFDSGVSDETSRKMDQHIRAVSRNWGLNTPGLHGLINKMIYQVYIAGAISVEWVLRKDLKGIDYLAFVNPEEVSFVYNKTTGRYDPYQVPVSVWGPSQKDLKDGGKKLNPSTYHYLGLFTDEELPYGTPPFLSAIDDIQSQLKMLKNIGFITDQLGIMGFLEILLEKPIQEEGEDDTSYKQRLTSYLNDAKKAIKDGTKDGVIAGYKDEHEFNFHATTKDTRNIADIFDINQRAVSTGLFVPSQFLGGTKNTAESLLQVVFTMMLSQLGDIQAYISHILEYGLWLELTLAGFNFDWLEVTFKPSTMVDQYKEAQTEELKIRNSNLLYAAGIISQPTFARRHGFDAPDQKEPRVPIDPTKVQEDSVKKKERQDKDNKSNKKTRDKNKSQPNPNEKRGGSKDK